MEFSEDDKMKIWIDYMVTQMGIKWSLHIFDNYKAYEERFDDSYKKYPTLNLATKNLWSDLKIRSFDDFCSEENDRIPCGLKGWYWRFKDRIFNK